MKNLIIFTLIIFVPVCNLLGQWIENEIVTENYIDEHFAAPQWVDLDSDGDKDLLSYNETDHVFYWRMNDGTNILGQSSVVFQTPPIEFSYRWSIIDWDHDGDQDILYLTNFNDAEQVDYIAKFNLLTNEGNLNFVYSSFEINAQTPKTYNYFIDDLNGDGNWDAIITNNSFHYIHYGDGVGFSYTNMKLENFIGAKRVDSDQYMEVFSRENSTDDKINLRIHQLKNNTLEEIAVLDINCVGCDPSLSNFKEIYMEDFDGDGDLDFANAVQKVILDTVPPPPGGPQNPPPIRQQTFFYQYIQVSTNTFDKKLIKESTVLGAEVKNTLVHYDSKISWIMYDDFYHEFGFDASEFVLETTTAETFPYAGGSTVYTVLSDFIFNESKSDIYFLQTGALRYINVRKTGSNFADHEWLEYINFPSFIDYEAIIVADMNADGLDDIVTTSTLGKNDLVWIENEQGCRFEKVHIIDNPFDLPTVYNPSIIPTAGDLDNDGDSDLVILVDDVSMYVSYNDGQGNFSNFDLILEADHLQDVKIEDLFNDDYPEIIYRTGSFSPGTIRVKWFDNQAGNFTDTDPNLPFVTLPYYEFADLDNDSYLDMFTRSGLGFDLFINNGVGFDLTQTSPDQSSFQGNGVQFDLIDYDKDGFKDIFCYRTSQDVDFRRAIYVYPNQQGVIDYDNPILTLDSLNEITLGLFVINQDDEAMLWSLWGALVYNSEDSTSVVSVKETKKIAKGDINNDGYDELIVGTTNGDLSFYSEGELDCLPIMSNNEDLIPSIAELKVFPNPASTLLTLESEIEGRFSLFDNIGRLILQSSTMPKTLDISILQNGMYIIQVQSKNEVAKAKFIKQID